MAITTIFSKPYLTLACRTQGIETHTSKTLRITGVALGAVALTVGVVALSGVFGAAPAAITTGGTLVGFGLVCMVAASMLKSVSLSHTYCPSETPPTKLRFIQDLHLPVKRESIVKNYFTFAEGHPTLFNAGKDLFIPCKATTEHVEGSEHLYFNLIYRLQNTGEWNQVDIGPEEVMTRLPQLPLLFPKAFDEAYEPRELAEAQTSGSLPAVNAEIPRRHVLMRLLSEQSVTLESQSQWTLSLLTGKLIAPS